MHSYNSDYDSDYMYDSVTSENQSLQTLSEQFIPGPLSAVNTDHNRQEIYKLR